MGIITGRDIDYVEDLSIKVKDVMSTDLIVGKDGCTLEEANKLML